MHWSSSVPTKHFYRIQNAISCFSFYFLKILIWCVLAVPGALGRGSWADVSITTRCARQRRAASGDELTPNHWKVIISYSHSRWANDLTKIAEHAVGFAFQMRISLVSGWLYYYYYLLICYSRRMLQPNNKLGFVQWWSLALCSLYLAESGVAVCFYTTVANQRIVSRSLFSGLYTRSTHAWHLVVVISRRTRCWLIRSHYVGSSHFCD